MTKYGPGRRGHLLEKGDVGTDPRDEIKHWRPGQTSHRLVIAAVSLAVAIAALAVLDAERGGDEPNIQGISDALWWAVTTITTVGYGDRYPTTGQGRLVGVGLMLAGIALLGVVTASFASWFLDKVASLTAAEKRAEVTLEHVLMEVRALRAEVHELQRTKHPQ